jgi:hypothetical protein
MINDPDRQAARFESSPGSCSTGRRVPMIFDQKDTRDMLVAIYVVEECAEAMEWMPMAPSQEAQAAMFADVCPAGPPPSDPDWKSFGAGIEYAAVQSAWLHEHHGREALVAEREYYEAMAADFEAEQAAGGRTICPQCGNRSVTHRTVVTLGYEGHPGAEYSDLASCERCDYREL